MSWHEKYQVSLPVGRSGDCEIREMKVDAKDAAWERLRAVVGGHGRWVPEGTYTGLYRKGTLWMSDTPDEIRDHICAIAEARRRGGTVLVTGLGLGMVAAAMLREVEGARDEVPVERVIVVEIDPDVIALVAPTLQARFGDRLEIVQADAYQWKPPAGVRFSVAWHDIWATLCIDNLAEMGRLHRRFARRVDWQGSWGRPFLKAEQRRDQRAERERRLWHS